MSNALSPPYRYHIKWPLASNMQSPREPAIDSSKDTLRIGTEPEGLPVDPQNSRREGL